MEGQGAHLGAGAGVTLQPGVVLPAGAAALRGLQGPGKMRNKRKEKQKGQGEGTQAELALLQVKIKQKCIQ